MYARNARLPDIEEKVLEYWQRTRAFEKAKELSAGREDYVFYDGPPFATGLPHYGHILSGTIKDTVGRFMYQQGFHVPRRFGWDCHGLPVEYEIDKKLGISNRSQILEMGIDKYNAECRSIVMKYSSEWESTVARMGRWVDFTDGYKTMDRSFMESVWFVFSQLYRRDKIYRGYKVMPFSTACKTPLSNFEANQNYKDVSDPSVLVTFPLLSQLDGRDVALVAWTTTPWTLPANCALMVNPEYVYSVFEHQGRNYVAHEKRVAAYFKDHTVLGTVKGADLVGREYRQLFDYYEDLRPRGFFRVLAGSFVTDTNGTAVVHCAPAFGEEDHKACVANGLLTENGEAPCPVDENGCFTLEPYRGTHVKALDKQILADLKDRVLMNARAVHSYPFCWRSDTPLIYKLVPNWFVRVKDARDALLRNNEDIHWEPQDIKYKRFHNWLEQARDWAIGRNRFWGTPIPIWRNEEDEHDLICVGSVDELERLSGARVEDLHREFVNQIVIERDGKRYRRVEEVLDCWFESGSMPYAQDHWPFRDRPAEDARGDSAYVAERFSDPRAFLEKERFPADFIGEGLDQTRGWFYTLHVLSTLLFDKPAFKNVVCFGIVLADDGKKMSKRLKNYPDPADIFSRHGADALRLYLISSPVVAAVDLRFSENGVAEINKVVMIPWANTLAFYMDCEDLGDARGLSARVSSASIGSDASTMDDWINASFDTFCAGVTEIANALRLNELLPLVLRFIDDLSNWYLRINRKALRRNGALLREILVKLSIVMAPFVPFFSEYCYQSIRSKRGAESAELALESVHHCLYPKTSRTKHNFDSAKSVIMALRQMREAMGLKLKRPLKCATVVCSEKFRETILPFSSLIASECNLLDLKFAPLEDYTFTVSVKPFFDGLRRDASTMKTKMAVIGLINQEQAEYLWKHKQVEVPDRAGSPVKITLQDALVDKKFKGLDDAEMFGEFGLIFDAALDEEIVDRTAAREFFSFVQKLRKSSGLAVGDAVSVSTDNKYLRGVIGTYYPEVQFGAEGAKVCDSVYTHDDDTVSVSLFKEDN
ncbi:isoleucyl-tRNA synthetase [Pancytospora philotis]|nr:isoleucyl-tRNA synthetase [Pancytospora philotis]